MVSLIKLEYRKAKPKTLMFLSIIAIPILIYWCVFNTGGHSDGYQSYKQAFADLNYYVNSTYLIINAVLISKIVLEEYRSKTITLLFSYPHPRSKLIVAKLICIISYIFFFSIVASLLTAASIIIHNHYNQTISDVWTSSLLITECYHALLFAIGSIGISLVSYFFGMLRKSIPAAIIPAFLITAVSSEFYYEGSLTTIAGISFSWLLIGLLLSFITINKEVRSDIQ